MMYQGGINRAERALNAAEENGRASQNPYAAELFREYVMPLAATIRADIQAKRAGARQAHVRLLTALDCEAVAFLAVRYVVSVLLSSKPETHRSLAYGIGRTVHRELILTQIHDAAPDLYHTLAQDLGGVCPRTSGTS